jgi:hypothetical protein
MIEKFTEMRGILKCDVVPSFLEVFEHNLFDLESSELKNLHAK